MSDPLRQAAQTRLATLRTELANGRDALTQLDARRVQIADTLLRIEGAVQVLEEVLATPEPAQPSADGERQRRPYARTPTRQSLRILPDARQRRRPVSS